MLLFCRENRGWVAGDPFVLTYDQDTGTEDQYQTSGQQGSWEMKLEAPYRETEAGSCTEPGLDPGGLAGSSGHRGERSGSGLAGS